MFRIAAAALVAILLVAGSPVSAQAQRDTTRTRPDTAAARRAIEQRLGRSVSQAEVLERLRQSGMTRAQARARLEAAGYDPGLADEYFDLLERGGGQRSASTDFIEALSRTGVTTMGLPDSIPMDSLLLRDSIGPLEEDTTAVEGEERLSVFGLDLFRRGAGFEPLAMGPVDAGYRLGPGDELMLILTGDVEEAYTLNVTREGLVFIPDVGQIAVNGLTLGQLEDLLYQRLGRVYSGLSRSAGATTRFSLSMGRLRANQVFLIGEVARPGAYQVSSISSVFNALHQAGGPTAEGSFRNIEVHRGGELIGKVDLYDYLLRGDAATDVRLDHNDRIFVPPVSRRVTVEGAVRRPALYELQDGEGLRDALLFAGGPKADAVATRVQIDRILPPDRRRPGVNRVLLDVDMARVLAGEDQPLQDGDVLQVFSVSEERRNRVWLAGEVRNPGLYEWREGQTLLDLLERADGLEEHAYTSRLHIYRLDRVTGTRRLVQAGLDGGSGGRRDLVLEDADSVVVYSRAALANPEFVSISGFVKNPDTYRLATGMTLRDLILVAGGFSHGAFELEAEVSRMPEPLARTDTTARILRVPLHDATPAEGRNGASPPSWEPSASEVQLQHGDRVFVRRAPGYESVREVQLTGEVTLPGAYVLATREERLSDLLQRAGGLTEQAYVEGTHVVRAGRIVAAELGRAIRNPRDRNNIVLQAGDSIHIPAYDPTVTVTGAVVFDAKVLYRPGKDLDWYIGQAGGYADGADRKRVTVAYQNGERAARRRYVLVTVAPRIDPGSTIFVPAKPEQRQGINWDQLLTRTLGIASATATLLLAVQQLK